MQNTGNSQEGSGPSPAEPEGEIQIETIGFTEAELAEGTDPRHDAGQAVAACGRPAGEPAVFLRVEALEKIVEHAVQRQRTEVAGLLLGRIYTHRGRLVTEAQDAMQAPQTRAGWTHVTFSHETWTAIFEQVDPADGLAIVGWYHSHPGLGVFLSRHDVFIHENFFDSRGHVALVVDPLKHHAGVYGWQEGRVVPRSGFWVSARRERAEGARRLASMLKYQATGETPPSRWIPRLLGRLRGRRGAID